MPWMPLDVSGLELVVLLSSYCFGAAAAATWVWWQLGRKVDKSACQLCLLQETQSWKRNVCDYSLCCARRIHHQRIHGQEQGLHEWRASASPESQRGESGLNISMHWPLCFPLTSKVWGLLTMTRVTACSAQHAIPTVESWSMGAHQLLYFSVLCAEFIVSRVDFGARSLYFARGKGIVLCCTLQFSLNFFHGLFIARGWHMLC